MRKLTKAQAVILASTLAIGTVSAHGHDETTFPTVTVTGFRPSFPTSGIPSWMNNTWGSDRYGNSSSNNYGFRSGGNNTQTSEVPPINCDDAGDQSKKVVSGNPVVLATGNKIEVERDFATEGEMGLRLIRTYNHFWPGAGLFGKHWISTFDYKLTFGTTALDGCYPRPGGGACGIGSNTVIYAWRPNGAIVKYVKAADGKFYQNLNKPNLYIVIQADGSFVLHGSVGEKESYSSAGYVTAVRNESGIGWSYSYVNGTYPQRITHTSGRYVDFSWSNGQLAAVRDPAGNSYTYAYAANQFGAGLHRLSGSTAPGYPSTSVTYHYEIADGSALTGKSINGARYSKFTYHPDGLAASTEHNGQNKYTFTYTKGTDGLFNVVETNPLNKETTYEYKYGNRLSVKGHPSTHCLANIAAFQYTGFGEVSKATDFNGNVTNYKYNGRQLMAEAIEAYGTMQERSTVYEWDIANNFDRLVSVTIASLRKTSFTYTGDNRLASETVTNISSNGVANQARSTTYAYTKHGNGMVATIVADGPLAGSGDAVTYSFNSVGDLTSVSNSLGHTTTYSEHTALGHPRRVVGPNGQVTTYAYDERGRRVRTAVTVNGVEHATLVTYDAHGRVSSVRTPDNVTTYYKYDIASRLIYRYRREAAGTFEVEKLGYNANSQVTSTEVSRMNDAPATSPPPPVPAPTGVATTASSTYTISWQAAAGADYYVVEESLDGGSWTRAYSGADTSWTASGKRVGQYRYRIRACSLSGGCSAPSAETVVVKVADIVPMLYQLLLS